MDKTYVLYHATNKDTLDINDKDIWLASDINYSKNWGENVFEVKIKLNNVFDAYADLGKKRLTIKQTIKYLNNKNINTDELKYALRSHLDSPKKYLFWQWIGNDKILPYSWLSFDIFNSGYDAIRLFEYGYNYRNKNDTFLVYEPKNKIISINLMSDKINEIITDEIKKLNQSKLNNNF